MPVCMYIIESRKRSWTDSTESLRNVGLIPIPKIAYTKSIQNVKFCDFDYFYRFKMAAVCIKSILRSLKSCIFKNKCCISGKRYSLLYVTSDPNPDLVPQKAHVTLNDTQHINICRSNRKLANRLVLILIRSATEFYVFNYAIGGLCGL